MRGQSGGRKACPGSGIVHIVPPVVKMRLTWRKNGRIVSTDRGHRQGGGKRQAVCASARLRGDIAQCPLEDLDGLPALDEVPFIDDDSRNRMDAARLPVGFRPADLVGIGA